jgi:hypothetical protein
MSQQTDPQYDGMLEFFPDDIQARMEARERFARNLPPSVGGLGLEYVVEVLKKWRPGQKLRVAFLDGDPELHKKIAETALEWTEYGNIKLDFGLRRAKGTYRKWSMSDTGNYRAEIRVSFHLPGYWSLVGTDSIDPTIVGPGEPSLNLSGFADKLPNDWAATVLHEFGHALGFHHEHQHPVGGCELDFRWDDDSGYRPTRDAYGQFIPDAEGRRPGLYTVLGGPPNRWPKSKVDFNLRQLTNSHAFEYGPFDPNSIMKYYFGAWMFRTAEKSHCFSQRNTTLSETDKKGIALAYPRSRKRVTEIDLRRRETINALMQEDVLSDETRERFAVQLESMSQ